MIEFEGNFQTGEVEVVNAEIANDDFEVDFDNVEPDFSDDFDGYEEPEGLFAEPPEDQAAEGEPM